MKNNLLKFILFIFILFIFFNSSFAQAEEKESDKVNLIYFYSKTCSYCQKTSPLIDQIEKKYSYLKVTRLEVRESQKARNLFDKFLGAYNIPIYQGGTPAVFIANQYLSGMTEIINDLEHQVQLCSFRSCLLKNNLDEEIKEKEKKDNPSRSKISAGLVIGTALVDSINPCAIAVLLFLIAFLLTVKVSKKRLFLIGFVYIFAVFLSYFLAGLGILKLIDFFDLSRFFILFSSLILFFAGLINLKSFFFEKHWFSLGIPERTKPLIKKYLLSTALPFVFLAGVLVSAFELPCTGEVYLGILSLISEEKANGYFYLIIYNLIFILPLLIILLLAVCGLSLPRFDFFQKRKKWVKMFIGLAMILLSLWLFSLTF